MKFKFNIYKADNLQKLKSMEENSIDSLVTDPPYGLGKEPNIVEVMRSWVNDETHELDGKGFMSLSWDKFVPQPNLWKEVFRVMKPGAHGLVFCGTRTFDWMVASLRFARFEIRDIICWHFSAGMPKGLNIAKGISTLEDKNEIEISGSTKKFEGWNTNVKPASEMIVLIRKPISEKTIVENVLKWGTGGINIDACRIKKKTGDRTEYGANGIERKTGTVFGKQYGTIEFDGKQGRWPANLILSHSNLCEFKGMIKVKSQKPRYQKMKGSNGTDYGDYDTEKTALYGHGDEEGMEPQEVWDCHESCSVKFLDMQSGDVKGWSGQNHSSFNPYGGNSLNKSKTTRTGYHAGYNDNGGASRFFQTLDISGESLNLRFIYNSKASKKDRNLGLEEIKDEVTVGDGRKKAIDNPYQRGKTKRKNFHTTVKPTTLMKYLIQLITPPNGKVLDPFMGSGSTGVAAKFLTVEGKLPCHFVGIELNRGYFELSRQRIRNAIPDNKKRKTLEIDGEWSFY